MLTVSVVGLGVMGSRMARRLVDAGYPTFVWNRSADRAAPLVEAGAKAVATPAQAAREADVTIVMVSDPAALAEATEGPDGVLSGCVPGRTVVQMSTVSPEATARLAALLPAGVALLDAPVMGSIPQVESGTLTVLTGGDGETVEQLSALLSVFGEVHHVGGVGAGTAAKLVANSALIAMASLLGESLALGGGLGLSRDTTFDVLSRTYLGELSDGWRPVIEAGEHRPSFSLALAAKDAALVDDAARAAGTPLPVLAAVSDWFAGAERAGHGALNMSAAVTHILQSRGI
ncbi:NAD(P)-dependent oxidoreductase [Kitasatospora sp. NPDC058170]|uniref:NAD(P)-dependent oxidoreductase n=1 Tax=Kitasatospora sp. NPDC058170 TaxID=3346364 RepID=UPI0036DA5FEB